MKFITVKGVIISKIFLIDTENGIVYVLKNTYYKKYGYFLLRQLGNHKSVIKCYSRRYNKDWWCDTPLNTKVKIISNLKCIDDNRAQALYDNLRYRLTER